MNVLFNLKLSVLCADPPGPIENSQICHMKNGVPTLLVNSDHAQVSDAMWMMLKATYGGGPEVVIRPAAAANSRPDEGNEFSPISVGGRSESTSDK